MDKLTEIQRFRFSEKTTQKLNQLTKHGINKSDSGLQVILIRGWGNLTGVGAHNLSSEVAANIQDTFAQWIVDTLNGLYPL